MVKAIRSQDIDVERYNLISRSLATDEELSARFQAMRKKFEEEAMKEAEEEQD